MVRVRNLVLAIAAASALTASNMAFALGVGEIRLESSLNQPLLADIELLDLRGVMASEIKPKLASVEDFKKLGIERPFALSDLTFTPMQRSDGRYVIRVTSTKPMREPYLSFLIEVLWPSGRLLREYTLLFDPPLYSPEAAIQAPHLPGSKVAPVAAPTAATAPTPAPTPSAPVSSPTASGAGDVSSGTGSSGARSPRAPAQVQRARAREYQVRNRDTLWGISEQVREVGSVHQNMAAIWDLNQEAFVEGNINRIQTGKVLRLPTADQVTSRSHPEAVVEVSRHATRWRRSPTASQDTRRVAASAPTNRPEPKDNLRLVAAAHTGQSGTASPSAKNPTEAKANDAEVQALRDELATAQEGLDSSRRESAELKDRLNDLQNQLDKLTRLMQLKDNQLAELQNQLGTTTAQAQRAKDEQEDVLAQLWTNPLLLGGVGGGALIAALLALLAARRKGTKESSPKASAVASKMHRRDDEPVLSKASKPIEQDDPLDRFGLTAPRSTLRTEDVGLELLDKAETFISYQQFNEAASVLRKAVAANPDRLDPHFKLMEVYGELKDADGFLREEAALRDLGAPESRIRGIKSRFPALGAAPTPRTTERPIPSPETAGLDFEALLDESAHPKVSTRSSLLGSEEDRQSSDLAAAMRAAKQREPAPSVDATPAPAAKNAEDPFADFDWELPEPKLSSASVQAAASESAPVSSEAKEPANPAPKPAMPDAFDLSQEEPKPAPTAEPEDNEELTTQLDLAKAYAEMGDKEGALDILKEVMREGSERQKQVARQIVSSLIK